MKKFYMLMVALLCGAAAMAQGYENEIYVPDVEVKAGSEATAQICLRNAEPLVLAITWKVQNPSGVNIKMPTSAAKYTLVPDRLDVETAKIVEKFWKKQEYDDGDIDEDEYNIGFSLSGTLTNGHSVSGQVRLSKSEFQDPNIR